MKIFNISTLIFACIYPSLLWLVAGKLELYPQVTYPLGKLIMIVLPFIIWIIQKFNSKDIKRVAGLKKPGYMIGIITGIFFGIVILLAYYFFLQHNLPNEKIIRKMQSLGYLRFYWAAGLFVAIFNSLIEEFYFRSFLLSQCANFKMPVSKLLLINGVTFSLHHFIAMINIIPLNLVIGLCAAIGLAGAVWAWLRVKGISIIDIYISHLIADLAIVFVIWDIVK